MDFYAPDAVVGAVKERVSHGIYGYAGRPDSLYDAIIGWVKKHHGWDIKKEWISFTLSVVPALSISVMAYTNPKDNVIIQSPVYPSFFKL